MNLPASLKERFGTSLAKLQREMPDANLDDSSQNSDDQQWDNAGYTGDKYRKKIRTNEDYQDYQKEKDQRTKRTEILTQNKFGILMDKVQHGPDSQNEESDGSETNPGKVLKKTKKGVY